MLKISQSSWVEKLIEKKIRDVAYGDKSTADIKEIK